MLNVRIFLDDNMEGSSGQGAAGFSRGRNCGGTPPFQRFVASPQQAVGHLSLPLSNKTVQAIGSAEGGPSAVFKPAEAAPGQRRTRIKEDDP
jgi:hypothetical protein